VKQASSPTAAAKAALVKKLSNVFRRSSKELAVEEAAAAASAISNGSDAGETKSTAVGEVAPAVSRPIATGTVQGLQQQQRDGDECDKKGQLRPRWGVLGIAVDASRARQAACPAVQLRWLLV